jgi:cytochrome P450
MERSHRCLGYEYTTMFMSVFLVHLLRSYTWTVPEQDLGYDWSCIPAEPKSGLQVELSRA